MTGAEVSTFSRSCFFSNLSVSSTASERRPFWNGVILVLSPPSQHKLGQSWAGPLNQPEVSFEPSGQVTVARDWLLARAARSWGEVPSAPRSALHQAVWSLSLGSFRHLQ